MTTWSSTLEQFALGNPCRISFQDTWIAETNAFSDILALMATHSHIFHATACAYLRERCPTYLDNVTIGNADFLDDNVSVGSDLNPSIGSIATHIYAQILDRSLGSMALGFSTKESQQLGSHEFHSGYNLSCYSPSVGTPKDIDFPPLSTKTPADVIRHTRLKCTSASILWNLLASICPSASYSQRILNAVKYRDMCTVLGLRPSFSMEIAKLRPYAAALHIVDEAIRIFIELEFKNARSSCSPIHRIRAARNPGDVAWIRKIGELDVPSPLLSICLPYCGTIIDHKEAAKFIRANENLLRTHILLCILDATRIPQAMRLFAINLPMTPRSRLDSALNLWGKNAVGVSFMEPSLWLVPRSTTEFGQYWDRYQMKNILSRVREGTLPSSSRKQPCLSTLAKDLLPFS